MKWTGKMSMVAVAAGLAGCVVVPTRRGAVVVGPPVPPPVVVAPAPPPPEPVEVVPVAPDPTYVWAPGWYFYDGAGYRHWHRGYWHHR